MLRRVAAVLLCLELVYLVAGNALVKSHLIQDAVASSDGFYLDFEGAYTLWPGHAHVRNVSLRVEDYNVQFEVALAQAEVDIALSELPFKKFHVTKLVAEGTRFRMRHKLIVVGDDAERVAANPPIKGFADPPYYVGVRTPTVSDEAAKDLWQVHIEDVRARVSELWVLEHRFQGRGYAHGSFVVKPTRWVQVEPAGLELEDGTLTLAQHRVAEHVRGRITCDIPDMRVQETEGVQVFRDILATIRLTLTGGKLDFLRAYLARYGSARYAGNADWQLDLNLARGVVQPGSHVDLRAMPFDLHHDFANLSGNLMASFGRDGKGSNALSLGLSAPLVVAQRHGSSAPSPSLEGIAGALDIEGTDLKADLALGAAKLSVRKAHVPALAWFSTEDATLRGSGNASLELERDRADVVSGHVQLSAERAGLTRDSVSADADLQSELAFTRPRPNAAFDVQKLLFQLTDATLVSGEKRSKPFAMQVDGSGLKVATEPEPSAHGMLRVHVSSLDALLPLVLGDPLRGITRTALDLKALEARASIEVSKGDMNVKVIDARSGNLRLRGYLTKSSREPRGAFLLSSGPINVGLTLSDGTTQVSPFVADDWLATTWPRVSAGPG